MRKHISSRAQTAMVALAMCASLMVAVPGAMAQAPAEPGPLRTAENYRMGDDPRPVRGRDIPGMAVNPDDPGPHRHGRQGLHQPDLRAPRELRRWSHLADR